MEKGDITCPGQNTMFWKPDDIYDVRCPNCDRPVEFWKDDSKRTCDCGHRFLNPKRDLGCLEYCKYAEQCMPEMFEGENGVEGLAIANKEKPDLIILDITMPVMTGIEMLEKLKAEKELKEIPVIMLTAESGKENVMKIVKMGVRDYMVKPFKGDQLIERAKGILKLAPKPA